MGSFAAHLAADMETWRPWNARYAQPSHGLFIPS
jgi:hypothetical protein